MKKLIGLVLGLILIASPAWGSACTNPSAGAVVSTSDDQIGESGVRLLQISYTTHASAGTFTCALNSDITGWLMKVQTDPGATAPTTLYDITITDDNGEDVMAGALADRSATVTESVRVTVENYGALSVNVTNAGNSKTSEILIYYLPF